MQRQWRVTKELFVLPGTNNEYFIYVPLEKKVLNVNSGTVQLLQQIKRTGLAKEKEKRTLGILERCGVIEQGESSNLPEVSVSPEPKPYLPTGVTIFPTFDCNLRCVYCYSSAGEQVGKNLEWEVAQGAIDFIVENAQRKGKDSIQVGFHGGGEPFVAFDLVRRVVEYTREQAQAHSLNTKFFSATNGILSSRKLEYLIQNFQTVAVSMDGPKDIQDCQRPKAGGQGSYESVMESISGFEERGFRYSVRSTVTAESVRRLDEIVDFFSGLKSLNYLHLEPLFECGRCLTTKTSAPDPTVFLEEYLKAEVTAKRKKQELIYSAAQLGTLVHYFCGASGSNFVVTPDGNVTTCFEVSREGDPRSEIFMIGKYEPESGKFQINTDKVSRLQERSVENLPGCSGCFAKYNCAGDCLAKIHQQSGDMFNTASNSRCLINKGMLFNQIEERTGGKDNGTTT